MADSVGLKDAVEAWLLRPLSEVETQYVDRLLERALRLITGALTRSGVGIDDVDPAALIDVQASMVARVLRNPDGFRSESDGQYSYQLDSASASGRLEVTDSDLELLGVHSPTLWAWHPYNMARSEGVL